MKTFFLDPCLKRVSLNLWGVSQTWTYRVFLSVSSPEFFVLSFRLRWTIESKRGSECLASMLAVRIQSPMDRWTQLDWNYSRRQHSAPRWSRITIIRRCPAREKKERRYLGVGDLRSNNRCSAVGLNAPRNDTCAIIETSLISIALNEEIRSLTIECSKRDGTHGLPNACVRFSDHVELITGTRTQVFDFDSLLMRVSLCYNQTECSSILLTEHHMNWPGTFTVFHWLSVESCTPYLTVYWVNGRSLVSDAWMRISALLANGFTSVMITFFGGWARWNVNECRPRRGFNARHSKLNPKSRSAGEYYQRSIIPDERDKQRSMLTESVLS